MESCSSRRQVCVSQWLLKEEVYVEQPQDLIVKDEEDNVMKFNKSLYGLK